MSNRKRENAAGAGGAFVGAVGGLGGAKATIATLGIPGLSGAGITTGLTAMGGSMLGGIAVASAGVGVLAFAGYFGGKALFDRYQGQ